RRRLCPTPLPSTTLSRSSLGTVIGALIGMRLIGGAPTLAEHAGPVAGMFVGTYVGGSINFNAVAIHFGVVEQGVVFAGAVVVDKDRKSTRLNSSHVKISY